MKDRNKINLDVLKLRRESHHQKKKRKIKKRGKYNSYPLWLK